jgi:superfamily II DNA/RNA helicase
MVKARATGPGPATFDDLGLSAPVLDALVEVGYEAPSPIQAATIPVLLEGHKLDALTRILEVETFEGMLIFTRTKQSTVELAERLEARAASRSDR